MPQEVGAERKQRARLAVDRAQEKRAGEDRAGGEDQPPLIDRTDRQSDRHEGGERRQIFARAVERARGQRVGNALRRDREGRQDGERRPSREMKNPPQRK
jgi:hypothetical protein